MTTRNLNRTWRDVVFAQYAADHEANVPFPVRYVINIPTLYGMPGRDVVIDIPVKIEVQMLKRAVLDFHLATRHVGDPTYRDENISVRTRKTTRRVEGETQPAGEEGDGLDGGNGGNEELRTDNGTTDTAA